VAAPAGDWVAYVDTPGIVNIRTESGRVQTLAIPAECKPAAASQSTIALDCYEAYGDTTSSAVLRIADGTVIPISLAQLPQDGRIGPPQDPVVEDVGRRWLVLDVSSEPGSGGHQLEDQFVVNFVTGRTIDLARDPFGAHHVFDLDHSPPSRRLCPGATRVLDGGGAFETVKYGFAKVVGHRVLIQHSDIDFSFSNCRTANTAPVPEDNYGYALGLHVLAHLLVNPVGGYHYVLRLRNFAQHTVQRLSFAGSILGSTPRLALSRHSLWITDTAGNLLQLPYR
jgi:hypothetical protein